MLPPKIKLPVEQQRLLDLFRALSQKEQDNLLAFAEFLVQRERSTTESPVAEAAGPLDIPRPDGESVVAAIRRLSQTFPMLDKDALLHDASDLMTEHVMRGRPAVEVIDELEVVFRRHYQRLESGDD